MSALERASLAIVAAITALAFRVAALAGREADLLLDDAFISFRYARNLARGAGLVFNPGEHVEGYTNFLWTVVLAACGRAGFDIPASAVALSLLAACGTIVVLAALGARLFAGRPNAALLMVIAPATFALLGCQSRFVLSGMETSAFVFLVTLGAFAYVVNRPVACGAVFALAALTRPEGTMYFAVVVAFELALSGRPMTARLRAIGWLLIPFAAIVIPYGVWRYAYFGALLPNTFYAKTSGTITAVTAARGWSHLLYAIRQSSLEAPLILALIAVFQARRERFWLLPAALICAASAEMVLVGGDFQFFFGPRLLMPAMPLLLLASAQGVGSLTALASKAGLPRVAHAAVAAAIAALAINAVVYSWPARDPSLAFVANINRGWTELGRWLEAVTPPNATIAIGAVGRIPYYSDRYTIDMLGLTDTHIAHLDVPLGDGMPGHEKYDTPYVLKRAPDYVIWVLLDGEGRPAVQDWSQVAESFEASYRLIALVKASDVPGPLVLETSAWSPDLAARGYLAGVYERTPSRQ